jgi:CheY-like chemotaxis protein
VEANEARLGQVFLNLIVNASQAIRQGNVERNTIRVSTSRAMDPGFVVVEVVDTGSGIDPQDMPKIFDAFFTTKPTGVGTGLGLSICHRIVTGMGGRIEVESTLGRGSAFRVFLPVSRRQDSGERLRPAPSRSGRRGRILAIDDEELVLRVISRTLDEHDVTVSTNAQAALDQLLSGERFDLILCDLMMPQMTGMDLYLKLKEAVPQQAERTVFMTGGAFTPEARGFIESYPERGIEKPLDMKQIRALIEERMAWEAK